MNNNMKWGRFQGPVKGEQIIMTPFSQDTNTIIQK